MIVVTGGAGFIGSNIVKALKKEGKEVTIVDDFAKGQWCNLLDCNFEEFIHRDDFYDLVADFIEEDHNPGWTAILHNGAISSTTAKNSSEVMKSNFSQSTLLLEFCNKFNIPFIYASSASVYGLNRNSREDPKNERPMNLYAFSKLLFDNYVRRLTGATILTNQVVGLRYFNVYGPGEFHKAGQSSPIFRYWSEIEEGRNPQVYVGDDGCGNDAKDCMRDFIHVDDVVKVVLWFLDHPEKRGIFNVGTGKANSFETVARYVQKWYTKNNPLKDAEPEFVQMPKKIRGGSQPYTKANLKNLKDAGYTDKFITLKDGVPYYLNWLKNNE